MNNKLILRVASLVTIAIWLVIAIWWQFILVPPDEYGIDSPVVQAQMAACTGTYQQRAECKEQIIDANERSVFSTVWLEKVGIIFLPPALLWYLLMQSEKERKRPAGTRRRAPKGPAPR